MAKKRKQNRRSNEQEDLVKVDIFYIPKAHAEMYRVLREAIAQDIEAILKESYSKVDRVQNPDEGEAVAAYDANGQEVGRLYLNPVNISEGQLARDKGQIEKFLDTHFLVS